VELARFAEVEESVRAIAPLHPVGPLELDSAVLVEQLLHYVAVFRVHYSQDLQKIAKVG
jgi:hypothetical protein